MNTALETPASKAAIREYVDATASLLDLQLSAESRQGVIVALAGILRLSASFSAEPLAVAEEPLPLVRL